MRSRLVILGLVSNSFGILIDVVMFCRLCLRSPAALAAENLFLRKQLGLYVERKTKPRRATDAVRFTLAQLMRLFEWRSALTVVKPDTLIRWHSQGIPTLLEVEIPFARSAESSRRCPKVDRRDGVEQSNMGRGTDRKRAFVKNRDSD